MIERFLFPLAETKIAQRIGRMVFPFPNLSLNVKGCRMFVRTIDRFAAVMLWKLGLLEGFEFRLIQSLCKPGMQIVDIGANIGFYTLQFSRMVGETGHVWAFEPAPGNIAMLRKNITINGYTNITLVEGAVSKIGGEGLLYLSESHQGDHRFYQTERERSSIEVKVYALDEYFTPFQRIDLVKMDIQGAEGLALMGMRRILTESHSPMIIMEFWPSGLSQLGFAPEEVILELARLGYQLKSFDERSRKLREIKDFQKFAHNLEQENKYANILGIRLPCEKTS